MRTPILAVLSAVLVVACSERPQTLPQSERRAEARDQTALHDDRRQRTLTQDESGRIHEDNVVR